MRRDAAKGGCALDNRHARKATIETQSDMEQDKLGDEIDETKTYTEEVVFEIKLVVTMVMMESEREKEKKREEFQTRAREETEPPGIPWRLSSIKNISNEASVKTKQREVKVQCSQTEF